MEPRNGEGKRMTREEAANVLWWASKQHYPGDQMDITEYGIEAFDMAIAALREPARKPCDWCNDGVMQIVDSPNKPPIRSNYCGLCGRKLRDCPENCAECGTDDD